MTLRGYLISIAALALLAACGPGNDGDSADPPRAAAPSTAAPAASPDASTSGERASRARIEVQGDPTVGDATVVVYLLEDGEGVSGAQVEVTGNMTHAGMTPVIATAAETEPGLYQTEDFRFTMAGDWILTAEIDLPGGEEATTESSVSVAAP